jgi:CelD/BcsL family acetyltransferase involved in cellulose biosynthesis
VHTGLDELTFAVDTDAAGRHALASDGVVTRDLAEDRWRRFVDDHPDGQVFHTPEMFEVFRRAKGHRPALWATLDEGGDPHALLLPVEITLWSGPFRRLTTRAVAHGGALCTAGPVGAQSLDRLLGAYRRAMRRRAVFSELRNSADITPLAWSLRKHGFVHEPHLNFLVDLDRPLPAIWESIRSNARRNIRRAERSGVDVEDVNDPERISATYAILASVYRRIRVPLPDISLFAAAFEILHPQRKMKVLVARTGQTDIGVLTLLFHRGTMLYWYTGILPEYAPLRASDLLVWRALELGHDAGCRVLDFGGAGRPDQPYGVRDFKAKFGGTLVDFGRDTLLHSPVLLKASEAGYRVARRMLRGKL